MQRAHDRADRRHLPEQRWPRQGPRWLLPTRGITGRIVSGGREAVTGLLQTNCHADLVDWRHGRRFRGEGPTLEHICAHLQARRAGRVDAGEATGILSHHLVHDDDCWRFLDTLLDRCNRHPGARWLESDEACLAQ